MSYRLLLLPALLSFCPGESTVLGPPEKVFGFVGGDVILPCTFNITASSDFPTVEWSKSSLEPNVIFLYRDGCETHEMKNPAFEYRTSFITKRLKDGDISLRISNVKLSDAGKYQCMRLWKNSPRDITAVELVVYAVSEPKLSVVSPESGEVTLQCETNCWQPEPEVTFLDHQGNHLPAEDPKRDRDDRGCNTVRRRLTLQTATSSVTCRVHQLKSNQYRDAVVFIPADSFRSCTLAIVATVALILVVIVACELSVWLWKRRGKSEAQKTPVTRQESGLSVISGSSDQVIQSQGERADNVGNSTREQLIKENDDLRSELREKDETIRQLEKKLSSLPTPVICQHNQPTIDCSPQRSSLDVSKPTNPVFIRSPQTSISTCSHNSTPAVSSKSNPPKSTKLPHNKYPNRDLQKQRSKTEPLCPIQSTNHNNSISSPALFSHNAAAFSSSSSVSTSEKKLGRIGRSMSVSCDQPNPTIPKPQRRHSIGFNINNRYSPLEGLKEESEPLVS